MTDVEGVHRKIQYTATYQIAGEETIWRGTFRRGDAVFEREGRIIHGWLVQAAVHGQVQVAIQLYIERLLLDEAFEEAARWKEPPGGQIVPGNAT
jgi:hypothetical protein